MTKVTTLASFCDSRGPATVFTSYHSHKVNIGYVLKTNIWGLNLRLCLIIRLAVRLRLGFKF